MDPIDKINFAKDTTFGLLMAAQRADFQLFYTLQHQLFLTDGEPYAEMRPLKVFDDSNLWYSLGTSQSRPLSELSVILMRKDPPFNNEYLYSTYILEAAERRGCLVANRPSSLRDCNEKIFATDYPNCTPPLLVSSDQKHLKEFVLKHDDIVLKPLDGMGGMSIFRVKINDPNLSVILETLTNNGHQTIMAQRYIPQISAGDKRVLIVGGEIVPYCLARVPSENDFRGNLAAGGKGIVQPLSSKDHWIASQIAESLVSKGLLLVGLDIIGEFLTEINVTSPTCVREIERETNLQICDQFIKVLEKKLCERVKAM
jgi:glutathione synthase